MRLTFEEIKSLAYGALSIEKEADGIHFYRMTHSLIETYTGLHKDFKLRALSTTGIRLDFITNSKKLAFFASSGNKFEIHINGLFREIFFMNDLRNAGKPAEIDLCGLYGEEFESCRVTLLFPSHTVGTLEWLELDDGATFTRVEKQKKMLILGDSITQGWEAFYNSRSYANLLTDFFDADTVNQGVGGAYFHESMLEDHGLTPDIITVAYGTNDFNRYKSLEAYRDNCRAYLEKLISLYPDCKNITVISPIWRDGVLGRTNVAGDFCDCLEIVKEEALSHSLNLIDGLSLVPPKNDLYSDKVLHPNDIGFFYYAHNLLKQLKPF